MTGKVRHFRRRRLTAEEGRAAAERILATAIPERAEKSATLHLDDPETLLPLLGAIERRLDAAPASALEEATFLYRYLEILEVNQPHDPILFDEREYCLGEAARIAGTACRHLSRRAEARRWLDLSESWFIATENGVAHIARVTYQRLALRVEEREFDAVLELLPHLTANFGRLGMAEDALKSRFLEAAVLKDTQRIPEAIEQFMKVAEDARSAKNETLFASAYVNLSQMHSFCGDGELSVEAANHAAPILQRLGNHIALAKLQWGIGYLLRSKGRLGDSVAAYRAAQKEFAEIEMHADVAAVHLVLADLLLDAGQPAQAEWEIRAALPIIEEYKLVPEGIAAYSLLRDSLRRRQIDRQALRNLHGYFRDSSS